jgi:hypothetical protein
MKNDFSERCSDDLPGAPHRKVDACERDAADGRLYRYGQPDPMHTLRIRHAICLCS